MAGFTQNFQTQSFNDLSYQDPEATLGNLTFQDFPATQDNYLQFTDFSQVMSCLRCANRTESLDPRVPTARYVCRAQPNPRLHGQTLWPT